MSDFGITVDQIFTSVSSYSSETKDYTIATGKKLVINYVWFGGAVTKDVKMELRLNPSGANTLIFATHEGGAPTPFYEEYSAGDVIRIKLVNSSGQSETCGAKWFGDLFDV